MQYVDYFNNFPRKYTLTIIQRRHIIRETPYMGGKLLRGSTHVLFSDSIDSYINKLFFRSTRTCSDLFCFSSLHVHQ